VHGLRGDRTRIPLGWTKLDGDAGFRAPKAFGLVAEGRRAQEEIPDLIFQYMDETILKEVVESSTAESLRSGKVNHRDR
jgi:hypothetical protein